MACRDVLQAADIALAVVLTDVGGPLLPQKAQLPAESRRLRRLRSHPGGLDAQLLLPQAEAAGQLVPVPEVVAHQQVTVRRQQGEHPIQGGPVPGGKHVGPRPPVIEQHPALPGQSSSAEPRRSTSSMFK